MQCEVDQSGKIEQTEKDTVLALSNDIQVVVRLRGKFKRELLMAYRTAKKSRFFPVSVFSAMLTILLKQAKVKKKTKVDREYVGYDNMRVNNKNVLVI